MLADENKDAEGSAIEEAIDAGNDLRAEVEEEIYLSGNIDESGDLEVIEITDSEDNGEMSTSQRQAAHDTSVAISFLSSIHRTLMS